MRRRFAVFACLIVLAIAGVMTYAASHAQERMCTMMWCNEGFMLDFTSAHWQAGQYRIEVDADGTTATCHAQLPLPPCSDQTAYTCSANDMELSVITSGCAMGADFHTLGGIRMSKIPGQIAVTVTLPDGTARSMASTVESQCGFPNGEGCDPRPCCSAHMALSLDK